jgi:hypothetical protein
MFDCHFPVYCKIILIPFTLESDHSDTVITSLNVVVIELPVTVRLHPNCSAAGGTDKKIVTTEKTRTEGSFRCKDDAVK